jgi:hypothetical protein
VGAAVLVGGVLLAGCDKPGPEEVTEEEVTFDTANPPEVLESVDTEAGRYHLELSFAPDPPVVGQSTLFLEATLLNSNPDLQGAALVGANLQVSGQHVGSGDLLADPIFAQEESLGLYVARFSWPQAGLWSLILDVGAAEDSDAARVGVEVLAR